MLPSALHLTPLDRAAIGPPLAMLVAFTALSYPLRTFPATLLGLQDMTFYGVIRIVQSVLDVIITVVLLLKGYGLYALAWGTVVPTAVLLVASVIRLAIVAPDLMKGWMPPALKELSPLVFNGFGVWLAGFGWMLLSSSNALVITFLGHPEWVPIFNCTAKVSLIATQLVWLMPTAASSVWRSFTASLNRRRVCATWSPCFSRSTCCWRAPPCARSSPSTRRS